ncbi:MAG: tRNA (adenosine(37)-N6)-threonylcarbamoyltransferase complex ATPase subunit type 1 TsaE [Acidimicrobiales bacterium]
MGNELIRLVTESAEDTRQMAAALAELARPGDVLLLIGDLGAGKTTFAQGFGRGLGVAEPITSPTFVLLRQYAGRIDLLHADMYRLDRVAEVVDLGLPELLDDGCVALVEWGEMAAPALAPDYLEVRIDPVWAADESGDDPGGGSGGGSGDGKRQIELRPLGHGWQGRWMDLELAIDRWRSPGPPP